MPKSKEERWQQYSFVAPIHVDIGDPRAVKKRSPRHKKDQDKAAVFQYIYEDLGDGPPPAFDRLTSKQQQIYRGIMTSEKKGAINSQEQYEAKQQGLTQDSFVVDEILPIPGRFCGHCANPIVRDVRILQPGKGLKSGQTRLLVNEYCPNCDSGGAKMFKVWVSNSQIFSKV